MSEPILENVRVSGGSSERGTHAESDFMTRFTYSADHDNGELARAAKEVAEKTRRSNNFGSESFSLPRSPSSSHSQVEGRLDLPPSLSRAASSNRNDQSANRPGAIRLDLFASRPSLANGAVVDIVSELDDLRTRLAWLEKAAASALAAQPSVLTRGASLSGTFDSFIPAAARASATSAGRAEVPAPVGNAPVGPAEPPPPPKPPLHPKMLPLKPLPLDLSPHVGPVPSRSIVGGRVEEGEVKAPRYSRVF
jgi:hypothetical protein